MTTIAALAIAGAIALLFPGPSGAVATATPAVRERRGPIRIDLVIAVGVGIIVLLAVSRPYSLVAAPLTGLAAYRFASRLEPLAVRRRRALLQAQLPEVIDLLSAALSAGAAPTSALALVGSVVATPMRGELESEVAKIRLGADPLTVWRSMAAHPQLGPLGRALERATDAGAPVRESLERLGDEMRAVRRSQVMVKARSVETKAAAPLGACLLPAFILTGVVPMVADQVRSLALF